MNNNVIFLDCTQGYGYSFSAANIKVEFLAKGLSARGDRCHIINSLTGLQSLEQDSSFTTGFADVISYKKKGSQFISWIPNTCKLYRSLRRLYEKDSNNVVILELPDYHIFLTEVLISRILHYRLIAISHEWATTAKSVHWARRPSFWLYSKTFGFLVDGILPISDYIVERIRHFNKPYVKIPVAGDFTSAPDFSRTEENKYFVYCGHSDYFRSYSVLMEGFALHHKNHPDTRLVLVLAGKRETLEKAQKFIEDHSLQESVVLRQNVPYEELRRLYSDATALLIPLDPESEQDKARFSQKTAEYISTGTPVITNAVGEMSVYFKHLESAVFVDGFSSQAFSSAFDWCMDNGEKLKEIGRCGYDIGKRYFDYLGIGKVLSDFLMTRHGEEPRN